MKKFILTSNHLTIFLFLTSIFFLLACKNDDEGTSTPIFDAKAFQAEIKEVIDDANNSNPNDILISFDGGANSTSITEYRIFYVTNSNSGSVTEEKAINLSSNSFLKVENSTSSFTVNFSENQLDFDGQMMIPNEDYVTYVLTIGTFNEEAVYVLSDVSEVFQLIDKLEVSTLIGSDFPANDGLFVNSDGTIFASNFGVFDNATNKYNGTKVFQITPEGDISEKASGFEAPMGGVMDSKGNFYFTNENNNDAVSGILVKVAPDGTTSEVGEIAGWPSGLTIDQDDNIYAANFVLPVINKISSDGTISVFATDDKLAGCVGIDVDKDGNIVTANFGSANILSISPAANVSLIATIPNVTSGFAIGYMTIFEDAIYATGINQNENVIFKVSFDGTSEIFAGTGEIGNADGELDKATFSQPNGIAADDSRRILYISQYGTPGLRKIQF